MANVSVDQILAKFDFLNRNIAKEPFVYEILTEVLDRQKDSYPEWTRQCATFETLRTSKNIKIPFTTKRDKNIYYLLEILIKNHPDHFRSVVTFEFDVNEEKKKLNINEIIEYTVMMEDEQFVRLRNLRDAQSSENLLDLVGRYRFFNLSNLFKNARSKNDLSRVIRIPLGKQIFTFKNFTYDKNRIEFAEDHCFHGKNYTAVRDSIKLDALREIIITHSQNVMKGLKKYGILNADFTDYRDTKLDYLFSILLEDMSSLLVEKENLAVKNLQSLRACLLKVDKILDPTQTLSADIAGFIREKGLCSERDIIGSNPDITDSILKQWATPENLKGNRFLMLRSPDGTSHYLVCEKYLPLLKDRAGQLAGDNRKDLSGSSIKKLESDMDLLCDAGKRYVLPDDNAKSSYNVGHAEKKEILNIIQEFENHREKSHLREEPEREKPEIPDSGKSIITRIIDFIKSLFGSGKPSSYHARSAEGTGRSSTLTSDDTRTLYRKIMESGTTMIVLSNLMEIIPENEHIIDEIINELRQKNTKTVIPIYNARKLLYPQRSRKLLMADTEYLLVSPEIIKSGEAIREFTDSLPGTKIKGETISGQVIMNIEKYLLTIYHQNKARQKRLQALKKSQETKPNKPL